MWYVGLDWADTHHDVEVLDEAGKRVGARRFAHSYDGLNELKQFVLSIATQPENLVMNDNINSRRIASPKRLLLTGCLPHG